MTTAATRDSRRTQPELEELRQAYDRLAEDFTGTIADPGLTGAMLAELQRLSDRIVALESGIAPPAVSPGSGAGPAPGASPQPAEEVPDNPSAQARAVPEPAWPAIEASASAGECLDDEWPNASGVAPERTISEPAAAANAALFRAAIRRWLDRRTACGRSVAASRAVAGVRTHSLPELPNAAEQHPGDVRHALDRQGRLVTGMLDGLRDQSRNLRRIEQRLEALTPQPDLPAQVHSIQGALDRQRMHMTALAIALQRLAHLLARRSDEPR